MCRASATAPPLAVPVDCTTTLLVARSGDPFASDEALLLRGMGRVLAQALRMLRALDNERALRARGPGPHGGEPAAGRRRSRSARRSSSGSSASSGRSPTACPIGEVLDSITEGAAELVGDDTASLRIIDETDPNHTLLLSPPASTRP